MTRPADGNKKKKKVPVEKKKTNKKQLVLVAYLILLLVLLLLFSSAICTGIYIVALVASSIKPEVETADMSTQQSASSFFLFFVVFSFLWSAIFPPCRVRHHIARPSREKKNKFLFIDDNHNKSGAGSLFYLFFGPFHSYSLLSSFLLLLYIFLSYFLLLETYKCVRIRLPCTYTVYRERTGEDSFCLPRMSGRVKGDFSQSFSPFQTARFFTPL